MLLPLLLPLLVTELTLLPLQPWHRDTAWPLLLPLPHMEEGALEALEAWVEPVDTTPWPWPTTTVRWAATEEPTVAIVDQALVAEETMVTRRDQVVAVETETSHLLPRGVDTDLSLGPPDRTVDRATTTAEATTHPHMATTAAVAATTQEAVVAAATTTAPAPLDMVVLRALEVVRVAQDLSAETVAVAVVDRPQVVVVAVLITLTNARHSALGICALADFTLQTEKKGQSKIKTVPDF